MRLLDDVELQIPDAVQRIVDAVLGKNVEITVSEEGDIILSFCLEHCQCQLFLVDNGIDDWRMVACVDSTNRDLFAEPSIKQFLEFGNHLEKGRLQLLLFKIACVLELRYGYDDEVMDKPSIHIAEIVPSAPSVADEIPLQEHPPVQVSEPLDVPVQINSQRVRNLLRVAVFLGASTVCGAIAYESLEKRASASSNRMSTAPQTVSVPVPADSTFPHLPTASVDRPMMPTGSCRIFSTILQANDRGPRPALQRLQNEYPRELTVTVFDPRTFTRLSIGPRHHAQQRARDPQDPRHAIGVTRHFHFNPPVIGDRFTIYVCPTNTVLIHYANDTIELYRTELPIS